MTNFNLVSTFSGLPMRSETKTGMLSLTDIFKIGNLLRLQAGGSMANQTDYLNTERTKAYIQAAAIAWGIDADEITQIRGTGQKRQTMAHISLAIHAAEFLSPAFHAEVIKEFVSGQLMRYRTDSAVEFVGLNRAIDAIPERQGKDNTGMYIQAAKKMKEKVQPDGESWDTASATQLRIRLAIEEHISRSIDSGYITDKDSLWMAIEGFRV